MPEIVSLNPAFHRCEFCNNIAEFAVKQSSWAGMENDAMMMCYHHAELQLTDNEMREFHIEEFEYLTKTTFEWESGAKETSIPLGFNHKEANATSD